MHMDGLDEGLRSTEGFMYVDGLVAELMWNAALNLFSSTIVFDTLLNKKWSVPSVISLCSSTKLRAAVINTDF